jgi:signal-transduction protein with cAMP-binding, CBS, and nucleotidyltransferase domain
MRIRELTTKAPVTISAGATVQEAAALMESSNVGALVVMDGDRLAGIVTDRDVVVRAVARGLTLEARIDGVMSTDVVGVDAAADVHDAYAALGKHGVRRLPVFEDGTVVGMLTVDDLVIGLASELDRLVRPIAGELAFGHHPTPVPAVAPSDDLLVAPKGPIAP